MVDVLVVGAGPAGAAAALVLARAGVSVRIVDRMQFPREKLCGDTLNPGALGILDRLGVGGTVRARALPVRGMVVTGPNGAQITGEYPSGIDGAAITRRELDAMLIEEATRAGAVFETGVVVRAPLVTSGGARVAGVRVAAPVGEHDLPARVVIAADGRGSKLANALGLATFAASPKRWAFGAYFVDVDGMSSFGEMHVREDGYIGVAPLPGAVTNVCVVRELAGMSRAQRTEPDEAIRAAVDGDPMLRDRFARARQVSDVTSLGPLAVDSRAAGCPGLLLAGDAAGFVDPMTGDGLRFALRGGELAADAAMCELQTGRPSFRELMEARRREFAGKQRLNRALRALAGSPRALTLAALVSRHVHAPVRSLIRRAGDVGLAQRRVRT